MTVGIWDVVLYAVAIAAGVATLTPAIMVLLGFSRIAVHVVPEVSVEPKGDDPDYQRRYRQFAELGFEPAGVTSEIGWFISGFDWYWRNHDFLRWMMAPDGKTLVTLYRLVAVEPVRFTIKSVFEGGAMVSTVCPGAGIPSEGEAHLRVEFQNLEPAELLAKHRGHVEAFALSRGRPNKACTFAEAVNADIVHDRAQIRSRPLHRRGVQDALILLAAAVLLAYQFLPIEGARLHRGAFAFVVGAAVFIGIRYLYLPKLAAQNALKTHAPAAPKQPPPAGAAGGAS